MQVPVVLVATKLQVTAVPEAGVAVSVTVAPEVKLPILISGVLSFVILSVLETPVSEAVARVGVPVAASPPNVIVRVRAANVGVSLLPPNSNIASWVAVTGRLSFHTPVLAISITE